jgi:glycosyltransferase involved in cell wall biosynthesis
LSFYVDKVLVFLGYQGKSDRLFEGAGSTMGNRMTQEANSGNLLTVVTGSFPPRISAGSILTANLLASYPGKLNVLCGNDHYSKIDYTFVSACESHQLVLPRYFPRAFSHLRMKAPSLAAFVIKIETKRFLSRIPPRAIISVFPWDVFLVGSFLAATELKLPFFPYMLDVWTELLRADSVSGQFARKWEPIILKQSSGVMCVTEAMQQHYQDKYGISSFLLPHTIAEKDFQRAPTGIVQPKLENPTVLFVGTVSPVYNQDSLRVLVAACELLPKDYRLMFCPSRNEDPLKELGISSSRVQVRYVTREEVKRLQSEAHVLIAPLSHDNCSRDEVRMIFSTKLLEYLVSGRPIIVFAPEESYHIASVRKEGWGYPVTRNSPEALAEAIVKVVENRALAEQLVAGALREARSRRAQQHARRLEQWIGLDLQPTMPSVEQASGISRLPRLA